MSMLQELYSKWELNEKTGDSYRTISMSAPTYSHVFAMEVMSHGHRKLYMEGSVKFTPSNVEFKRLLLIEKPIGKISVRLCHHGETITHGIEIL